MAIHDKYFPGSTVSRYLPPGEHSWDEAIYQSGKPVLDAELNLSQEVNRELRKLIQNRETPSGWLRGPVPLPFDDFSFAGAGSAGFIADSFRMVKRTALVANMPVTVEYTNTVLDGYNRIQLDPAPAGPTGTPPVIKRTDFVFLEVWRALVSPSPTASATLLVLQTPTSGSILLDPAGAVSLTPAGAPRTSGSNDYDNTLGTVAAIAADIRDAINDAANFWALNDICSAEIDITTAEQVNLRALPTYAGAAGNTIQFTTTVPADFTLSGAGLFTGGADTLHKPTQSTIYRNGNVLAPAAVNLADEIADPTIGTESTKRVQIQYRIRTTGSAEAVDFRTQNGFSNSEVEAQGAQLAPVSRYRFVPANNTDALAYIEVTAAPLAAGDVITINGVDLTGVSGARTPGSDDFDATLGTTTALATEIHAAILDAANSFSVLVSASVAGDLVTVEAATVGGDLSVAHTAPGGGLTTATNSAVAYDIEDNGLFIAGDGTEAAATALGTVDGYSYAIPIAFVFRRNDATAAGGWDPVNNTNGALAETHAIFVNTHGIGTIPADTSDRPDQNFYDAIVSGDLLDLRRHVSPGGVDLKAELESQMTALLDGNFHTWAIDTEGVTELGNASGDVSSIYLVCNEIGSSDTLRGETIGCWDHVRRRFADQPVVERRVFPILPTATSAANPGLYATTAEAGWQENMVINIDLDSLDAAGEGNWTPTGTPDYVTNLWPTGTKVTDVLRVVHDDGHYAGPNLDQAVEIDHVSGVGTPHVQITLGPNSSLADGGMTGATAYPVVGMVGVDGSPRRIFVELEITYPAGSGASATPDELITADPTVTIYRGSGLENDISTRPDDWDDLIDPQYRTGKREIGLEYVANNIGSGMGSGTPITEQAVSSAPGFVTMSRRLYGSSTTTITVTELGDGIGTPRSIDTTNTEWGSSERKIVLSSSLSANQSLCNVEYFAQDPLPNWGGTGGYQVSVYYRSNAPQTVGVQAGAPSTMITAGFPVPLTVQPLVMSRHLWTNISSVGSTELPFPYTNPSDPIAVNGDLTTGGTPAFPGEWALMSLAKISVGDFDADAGLLNLHQMVPVDPNSNFTFSDLDWDTDFRAHFKMSAASAYRPTAMAQPLSGVATHKVWLPFLAQASEDSVFFRRGEVLLVVVSRYALLDGDNVVRFTDTDNATCAAVYRTRGLLLLATER